MDRVLFQQLVGPGRKPGLFICQCSGQNLVQKPVQGPAQPGPWGNSQSQQVPAPQGQIPYSKAVSAGQHGFRLPLGLDDKGQPPAGQMGRLGQHIGPHQPQQALKALGPQPGQQFFETLFRKGQNLTMQLHQLQNGLPLPVG